jgi:hypothetical protein
MDRKRFIVKMALAAIIVFAISSGGRIFELLQQTSQQKQWIKDRNKQLTELSKEYQEYLDKTAAKIRQLPINHALISQTTSDILKKSPLTRLYLWMSNAAGEFVFGTPAPVFERLNKVYDKYRSVIEADGYYLDRNDFLLKLVHRHANINFSQFETRLPVKEPEPGIRHLKFRKLDALSDRFYKEKTDFMSYISPLRLELSTPVMDNNQAMIGTLYLKIDDYTVPTWMNDPRGDSLLNTVIFPAFEVLFVLSLLFLWFLLPSWVYIDARQRDVTNATRWALLTVISFGFAWLVYLIVRPGELKAFHCPQCEQELNGTKTYCPYCGFDLSESFCPQCQYPVKSEWQFCPGCRNDLTKKMPAKEEIPVEKSK